MLLNRDQQNIVDQIIERAGYKAYAAARQLGYGAGPALTEALSVAFFIKDLSKT